MGLRRINVAGLQELLSSVEVLKEGGNRCKIFVLFCGSTDQQTGHSWCSDCVKADPVIENVASKQSSGVLITCSVGDRPAWKDLNNPFRTNLKLTGVPTLMEWETTKRLNPEQCADEDLVKMLFEED
ncbi:PREDICTED: thioredoxin domain-containing protein 17-like [Amphimedon queenslandica]|uniref:Thioredoxin domain-containing protein 17 n=1 Tax=Amphimedon queenslandica TaxID=400682 RepID=A0A1X7UVZ8_AMPQE|nr:PREDICTED: thioredoxin domain-containing protein 17-like [Amphimedon queenslandica]|eukprot:XP_003386713.1 PREDICTED: thioredoxin domain-containing protein 17-like [Amphimedon queenslandica]